MNKETGAARGNYISEWFGHRVYPRVISTETALADQQSERCPFLSDATGEDRTCIKSKTSRGICTISSPSNGLRQDWLVCPYRALNSDLVGRAVRQLFGLAEDSAACILPATNLSKAAVRKDVEARLNCGGLVFIYFEAKLGGELSIPQTPKSPEFSFDVTIIELVQQADGPHVGRFGILEIQTMDFHGSYSTAVNNLRDALRLHGKGFGHTLQEHQQWLSQGVEGPNIANVFKRTFYQMMFKFQLGHHERCAGCVLAIPQSVWDSWQKHLGGPELRKEAGGTFSLIVPGEKAESRFPAWIYVFDTNPAADVTPSPIKLAKMIGTNAPSVSYWTLDVAPKFALSNVSADGGLLAALARRLRSIWPELADTVSLGGE